MRWLLAEGHKVFSTPASTRPSGLTTTASSPSPSSIGSPMTPPVGSKRSSPRPGPPSIWTRTSRSWPESLGDRIMVSLRPRHDPPLPRHRFLQASPLDVQEAAHLLAVLQRQAAGFQALVYLHRYNEGTLSRMRTEYVIPLLGKIPARIGHLTDDITGRHVEPA